MIQASSNHDALSALVHFSSYAASTLLVLDLIGTFVFALSGAAAGVKERLDLFGMLVLSFATASAGGIMRDLLIGSVPPAAISDWRYLAAALLAGLIIFFGMAALAGALVVLLGHVMNLPPTVTAIAGATLCFGMRLIAIRRGWRLPVARFPADPRPGSTD